MPQFLQYLPLLIGLFTLSIFLMLFYLIFFRDRLSTKNKSINTLIPLLSTWVGTILAGIFGRENFNAAASKYQAKENELSPEVLNQVKANQIMILKKTMITKPLSWAKGKKMEDIFNYMQHTVEKSRLPLLENGVVAYILHAKVLKSVDQSLTFEDYLAKVPKQKPFVMVSGDDTLEMIKAKMSKESGCEDAIVVSQGEKLEGWITDSLIDRYLSQR